MFVMHDSMKLTTFDSSLLLYSELLLTLSFLRSLHTWRRLLLLQ
eukprot:14327.XXX_1229489_1229620_1 [CDS] Oithona nana genome sequencing.